jgi:hypothetical protein
MTHGRCRHSVCLTSSQTPAPPPRRPHQTPLRCWHLPLNHPALHQTPGNRCRRTAGHLQQPQHQWQQQQHKVFKSCRASSWGQALAVTGGIHY